VYLYNDIVVLNGPIWRGAADHQAILIGDDERGWDLISREGYGAGTTIKHYDTLEEALSSAEVRGRYDSAYIHRTTSDQDDLAFIEGWLASGDRYGVLGNNCGDIVRQCLEAAGIEFPDTTNPRATREFMEQSDDWEGISDQLPDG
jgi:hypothetical protein